LAFLKSAPKAKSSAGQVIEPVANEYIDRTLDNGNMTISAIQRKVVATPCPAVLVTNIHLAAMIRKNR